MIDSLLQYIAPHYCCSCGAIGSILCGNCKYDIIDESFAACVACGSVIAGQNGLCSACRPAYARAWCISARTGTLKEVIDHYKFMNARAAYRPLASLLHEIVPELPRNAVIIPVPTISSHIRQRGYDHMSLISREFARRRQLVLSTGLQRRTSTSQHDAGKASIRRRQAKEAFVWQGELDSEAVYILLDDVVTTGATLHYAAKTLRGAGAQTVWVAALSRQPLSSGV